MIMRTNFVSHTPHKLILHETYLQETVTGKFHKSNTIKLMQQKRHHSDFQFDLIATS